MRTLRTLLPLTLFLIFTNLTAANASCADGNCCASNGGVSYCDSSSGRYVCRNGNYSACYCTRHAIMSMDRFRGCCMWHGGVYKVNAYGAVICNDNSVSELCSAHNAPEKVASW